MALNLLLHKKPNSPYQAERIDSSPRLLADLEPNSRARILGFAPQISVDRKAHLQAYGILPGNILRVHQKRPVTIIQVEHTELALESDLAELIYVASS